MSPRARKVCTVMALASACTASVWAQAPDASAPPRVRAEVSRTAVEQKTTMLDTLLFNSPLAARIGGSANEQARRHLTDARELFTHARALARTGQLRGADALLNEAIWEIGRAQQLAPDQSVRLADERARYQQLKDSVDALLRTYQISELAPRNDAPPDRTVARVAAAIEQARGAADEGRIVEANRTLEQALTLLLKDALSRLSGQTLVYDRRFANSRDEYAFELERFRSYEALIPLALVEYRPSREAMALIDRYVKQGRSLRERADAQAAANDHAGAVLSLVEGTDVLQRALQASGLSVPQTMGSP
jgi:cell division septum initiation protein DivIVA